MCFAKRNFYLFFVVVVVWLDFSDFPGKIVGFQYIYIYVFVFCFFCFFAGFLFWFISILFVFHHSSFDIVSSSVLCFLATFGHPKTCSFITPTEWQQVLVRIFLLPFLCWQMFDLYYSFGCTCFRFLESLPKLLFFLTYVVFNQQGEGILIYILYFFRILTYFSIINPHRVIFLLVNFFFKNINRFLVVFFFCKTFKRKI